MYTSENNWYKWNYGTSEMFGRQTSNDKFNTYYGKSSTPVLTFKQELLNAASSTMDHYSGLRPSVFLSGGVDSEMILKSYIDIGSNPEVFIVRYENDYNLYDVSYAITICSMLDIKYNLIDFNLQKFYETDAEKVSEEAQICRPRMLPHLKFTENIDGLVIVGHSDMAWYREDDDYSKKGKWFVRDYEHDIGCDKYNMLHNRPAIYQWFKWSPGLILSFTKLNWFNKLINDEYYGKLGINSTKIFGYREYFPELINRSKQTGFEKIDIIVDEVEKSFIKKYNGLPYRRYVDRSLSELRKEITGS